MTQRRKSFFLVLSAAGIAFAIGSPALARESLTPVEPGDVVHPPETPRSPGRPVAEPGRLLVDIQPPKLISDEQLETRIAAAKASVAPVTPVVPFELSRVDQPVGHSAGVPSQMPAGRVFLSSQYGLRVHPIDGGLRMHSGVDLAGVAGTPVYATADGVVEQARWFGSYGLFVELKHVGKLETRYGHLSGIVVAPGQRVKRGELVGFIGSTGNSTGPHLHYEVRRGGQAVNPVPFLLGGK